jgi:SAM-dependent methyltransferase
MGLTEKILEKFPPDSRLHSPEWNHRILQVRHTIALRLLKKTPAYVQLEKAVSGKKGLEIGGPSPVFGAEGILPLYALVGELDGCNFSNETVWEGKLTAGKNFKYAPDREPGTQFIDEASELSSIPDRSYDFVLSSHCLEHCANPLRALRAWHRVLKPGGALLILLPSRFHTFDRKRPITPFAHLLEDFDRNVGEDDLTHFEEIIRLHDYDRDQFLGENREQFADRVRNNFQSRGMHQHVFDCATTDAMLDWCGGLTKVHTGIWGGMHIAALRTRTR